MATVPHVTAWAGRTKYQAAWFLLNKVYMQFYGISFMRQAHPAIDHTAYMDAWKKYHKPACTSLPEDEHLDFRNMSKTL
jgi:hypothetical protein